MRVGSNGSIPEFIASLAEAIEEAVSENETAECCEISAEPYVGSDATYSPSSYGERTGFDHSGVLQSNLLKNVGKAIKEGPPAVDEKLAGSATQGNATDYLMAATGKGGTSYAHVSSYPNSNGIQTAKFEADFNAGKTIAVSTGQLNNIPACQKEFAEYGLKENHVYTVKRVYTDDKGQKMAELSDPTGQSQPRPIPIDRSIFPIKEIAIG